MIKKLDNIKKFNNSHDYKNQNRKLIDEKLATKKVVFLKSIAETFDYLKIKDGMTLSFHHHLRNGDFVMNLVSNEIVKRDIKNLHLAPSSIFPNNEPLTKLIKNQNITNITTNYLSGPVAECIQAGHLDGLLLMHTHGGRARAIEAGEIEIDVAFLATPQVDKLGNGTGSFGNSPCGSLGYAISDLKFAKKVILVTDNIVDLIENPEFESKYVDLVVVIDKIGDSKGIVSGTTRVTRDPIGLQIASKTANLLNDLGLIKDGFSMQTGAGGTSLAVADYVKEIMINNKITGSFASGGITSYFVDLLKMGLFKNLYDVQCFDLEAIKSYGSNPNHIGMSASTYANPYDNPIVNKLDFVILGATEIDINFNVNVTTDSYGKIIGGSGGHSDTAHGAKVTVIVANLLRSRIPMIKQKVTTITTPGEDVDILVTERGIAINPKRKDLIKKLEGTKNQIYKIEELMQLSHEIAGVPNELDIRSREVVGAVIYRDGTLIDYLYKSENK